MGQSDFSVALLRGLWYNEHRENDIKEMIPITEKQLIVAIHSSMYHQIQRRGYAAPVDVLIDCGVLTKKAHEEWRFGRVSYLEKCCTVNLKKLSFIMHQIRVYAQKNNLKPSICVYKRWGVKKKGGQGHKPVIRLRFNKRGDEKIEQWYSTHYLDIDKINQLKERTGTIKTDTDNTVQQ